MSVYPDLPTHPTILDWAGLLDPQGNIAQLGEMMNQMNQVLDDMVWQEGNLPTGHKFAMRTGLPEPTWRRFYQGVQPTKSARTNVTVSTGMMEDYAEVDKALADLNGNTSAFRMSEDKAHIEGITQKLARYIFYGNEAAEPEAITGFAPHFNSKAAGTGEQIIDAGGVGTDNASIWLIGWSTSTVYGIFPKGSKAGLSMTDKGQVTAIAKTADGVTDGYYEAYRTHYRQDAGLCVQDWRYVVRIANIDRSTLVNDPSTSQVRLYELMGEALDMVPSMEGARFAFYADRTLWSKLRVQMANAKNVNLTTETVNGKRTTSFYEVPLRRVDALRVDEAPVT